MSRAGDLAASGGGSRRSGRACWLEPHRFRRNPSCTGSSSLSICPGKHAGERTDRGGAHSRLRPFRKPLQRHRSSTAASKLVTPGTAPPEGGPAAARVTAAGAAAAPAAAAASIAASHPSDACFCAQVAAFVMAAAVDHTAEWVVPPSDDGEAVACAWCTPVMLLHHACPLLTLSCHPTATQAGCCPTMRCGWTWRTCSACWMPSVRRWDVRLCWTDSHDSRRPSKHAKSWRCQAVGGGRPWPTNG